MTPGRCNNTSLADDMVDISIRIDYVTIPKIFNDLCRPLMQRLFGKSCDHMWKIYYGFKALSGALWAERLLCVDFFPSTKRDTIVGVYGL